MKFIKDVWNDVKKGENLDLYITIFVALILVGINTFGKTSESWFFPLTVSVLSLLTITTIGNRHRLELLLNNINKTSEEFFTLSFSNEIQNDLNNNFLKAKDSLILGVTLGSTLDILYPLFEKKIQNGDCIRVVLVNPNSVACDMTAMRRYRMTDPQSWRVQIESTLNNLLDLQAKACNKGKLEIRVIDFPLSYGGILINPNTNTGVFYIWHYSFKAQQANSPKFMIRPSNTYWTYWYKHFKEETNMIWNNATPWGTNQP